MTATTDTKPDIRGEIRDANLALLSATSQMLTEADRVRMLRHRLMRLIEQTAPQTEQPKIGGNR